MELTIMLNDAISSIQNLENYYMNQIDIVMKQVRKEMKAIQLRLLVIFIVILKQ